MVEDERLQATRARFFGFRRMNDLTFGIRNYSSYCMKGTVQLAKIGNSQGIRLSKQLLSRYQIEGAVEMETTPDAIIIRPVSGKQLSWEATYREMAASEDGDWSDWDAVAEDGLEYGD
jgi:antitoxin MazE